MVNRESTLATELLGIAKVTRRIEPGSTGRYGEEGYSFTTEDGAVYEIDPEGRKKYEKLPLELLKNTKSERQFSEERVAEMVDQAIGRLVDRTATAEAAASELHVLVESLLAPQPNQTALYKLPGVTFPIGTRPYILAGARVARFTDRDYRLLIKQCRGSSSSAADSTTEKFRQGLFARCKQYLDQLKGQTVVWCSYAAEATRADELSRETLRWITILLKYASSALHPDNVETAIGVSLVPWSEYLIVSDEEDSVTWGRELGGGKYRPWIIFPADRAGMDRAGVFALSGIVEKLAGQKPKHGSFQGALLEAVQWTATSLDQPTNGSKILALAVALETIFSPGNSSKTSAIAEGTAMVISRDPRERLRTYKRMEDLYNKRSRTSHGDEEDVSDQDIVEMNRMVTSVIGVLCRHADEYDSLDNLSAALLKAKLTGPVFKGR